VRQYLRVIALVPGAAAAPSPSAPSMPNEAIPEGSVAVPGARIRGARRQDAAALVDLRVRFLAETARIEPRFGLMPDVREKTSHAMPVWLEQEDRVLLVVEEAKDEHAAGPLRGYATGLLSVWPPVFREQHVGEVLEMYVDPVLRGRGIGRGLLHRLTDALVSRGARVLRALAPVRNADLLARFRSIGYLPVQYVMERNLEEL
jgi:GNAT superfamily N-acetyltransferase